MTEEIEKHTFYYPSGRVRSEVHCKGEIFHGLHRGYHENGVLSYECTYVEGVPDGLIRQWDEGGNLIAENHLVNGTGVEKIWDNTNKSWSELSWVDGTWTGRFRVYWSDGAVAADTYWIKNRKVTKKKYVEMCEQDDSLPKYEDLTITKTSKLSVEKRLTKKKQFDHDDFYKKLFAENEMVDAMEWLTESDVQERTLGECTRQEDSVGLVQDFIKIGAVKIWTFDIEGGADEEQNSGKLVIELPRDENKRKTILEKCGEIAKAMGFDSEPDTGQKYTFLMLD